MFPIIITIMSSLHCLSYSKPCTTVALRKTENKNTRGKHNGPLSPGGDFSTILTFTRTIVTNMIVVHPVERSIAPTCPSRNSPRDGSSRSSPKMVIEEASDECTSPRTDLVPTHAHRKPTKSPTNDVAWTCEEPTHLFHSSYADIYAALRVEHAFCLLPELEVLWSVPGVRAAQFCQDATGGKWNFQGQRRYLESTIQWLLTEHNRSLIAQREPRTISVGGVGIPEGDFNSAIFSLVTLHDHYAISNKARFSSTRSRSERANMFDRIRKANPDQWDRFQHSILFHSSATTTTTTTSDSRDSSDRIRKAAEERWALWEHARDTLKDISHRSFRELCLFAERVQFHSNQCKLTNK